MRKEEGESGTNPEPFSEAEIILEEIDEQILSAKVDLASATAKDSEQQKNERKKAMAIRDAAMNTWAKSKFVADSDEEESASEKPKSRKRRRGSDALQYLEAKCQVLLRHLLEGSCEIAVRMRTSVRYVARTSRLRL